MKKTLLIIAASALATGALIKAAPALAEAPATNSDVNVSVVRTADLDLTTPSGERRLDQRLIIAASEVCGDASDADLKGKNDERKCRKAVLSAARAKADAIVAGVSTENSVVVAAQR